MIDKCNAFLQQRVDEAFAYDDVKSFSAVCSITSI